MLRRFNGYKMICENLVFVILLYVISSTYCEQTSVRIIDDETYDAMLKSDEQGFCYLKDKDTALEKRVWRFWKSDKYVQS